MRGFHFIASDSQMREVTQIQYSFLLALCLLHMYVSPVHACFFPETIVGEVFKLRRLEFGVKSSLMAQSPKSAWIWWRQLSL